MSDPLIWYHSKPLDYPYSPYWNFFSRFLQQTGYKKNPQNLDFKMKKKTVTKSDILGSSQAALQPLFSIRYHLTKQGYIFNITYSRLRNRRLE